MNHCHNVFLEANVRNSFLFLFSWYFHFYRPVSETVQWTAQATHTLTSGTILFHPALFLQCLEKSWRKIWDKIDSNICWTFNCFGRRIQIFDRMLIVLRRTRIETKYRMFPSLNWHHNIGWIVGRSECGKKCKYDAWSSLWIDFIKCPIPLPLVYMSGKGKMTSMATLKMNATCWINWLRKTFSP